jgi:hypothetical protein
MLRGHVLRTLAGLDDMRKKGFRKEESPEKMPVVTTGFHMSRDAAKGDALEAHRGANAAADETLMAKLVCDFIASSQ